MHSANKVFVAAFALATVLLATGQLREWALAAADYAAECIGLQEPAEAQTFNAIGGSLLRGISTSDPRCTTPCCRSPACGPGQTFSCPSPRRPETRRQCLGCATDNTPACPGGLDPQCTGTPANSRWVCPTNPTEACPETRPSCSSGVNPTCSGSPNWEWVCPVQTLGVEVDFACLGATLDRILCAITFARIWVNVGEFQSCGTLTSSQESATLTSAGPTVCLYAPLTAVARHEYRPNTAYDFTFNTNPTPGSLRITTPPPAVLQRVFERFGGQTGGLAPGTFAGTGTTQVRDAVARFAISRINAVQAAQSVAMRTAASTSQFTAISATANAQRGAIISAFRLFERFLGPVSVALHFLSFIHSTPRCNFLIAGGPVSFTRCAGSVERCSIIGGGSALSATLTTDVGANTASVYYYNGSGTEQRTRIRCRRGPTG